MNTRILDALRGETTSPVFPTFDSLKPGQPFKWVKENESARRGVCIKVKMITGKFAFSTGHEEHGWVSLETEHAGTVCSNSTMGKEVIPL